MRLRCSMLSINLQNGQDGVGCNELAVMETQY